MRGKLSLMANRRIISLFFLLFFLSFRLIVTSGNDLKNTRGITSSDNQDSLNRRTIPFNFNQSDPEAEKRVWSQPVVNEALVQIYCILYPNSTGSITLLIKPETEWNVTHIPVGIDQEINLTVTNGIIRQPPASDVAGSFDLWIQRNDTTAVICGKLISVILFRGWDPVPWPNLSGIIALLLLTIIARKKRLV